MKPHSGFVFQGRDTLLKSKASRSELMDELN